jgi:hypothetical protein
MRGRPIGGRIGMRRMTMRLLAMEELVHVSGAGGHCCKPPKCKEKGNNGYGNGGHDGVPGHSGKQDYSR